MADSLTKAHRSWNMSRIRARDTKPELIVRSVLHRLGFRFRLSPRKLPGSPDVVLTRHRIAVYVHGCFWHRHRGCRFAYTPKSNIAFWLKKFAENVARDHRANAQLRKMGWRIVTVWECQCRQPERLQVRLAKATLSP